MGYMNILKKYLKEKKRPYVPWAEENGLSPATVYRYMRGDGISPRVAKKISEATLGELSVMDILYRSK